MSPTELVERIAQSRLQDVPEFLSQHLALLSGSFSRIQDELTRRQVAEEPASHDEVLALAVASTWLWALTLTQETFVVGKSDSPQLTAFGAWCLAQTSLQLAGLAGSSMVVWPSADELGSLAACLDRRVSAEETDRTELVLLGTLGADALRAAQPTLLEARQALALVVANCADNLLEAYLATEQPDQLLFLEQALTLYALAEPALPEGSLAQAICRVNWAGALQRRYEAQSQLADLEQALLLQEQAIETCRRAGWLPLLQRALVAQGHTHVLAEHWAQAHAVLGEALTLLEQHLVELPEQDLQLHLLLQQGDAYTLMIHTCLTLAGAAASRQKRRHYEQEAWAYAERSKARLTVQLLLDMAEHHTPTEVQDQRLTLLGELARLRREQQRLFRTLESLTTATSTRTTAPATEPGIAQHKQRETELELQATQVFKALAALDPALAALQEVKPPNLQSVQAALTAVPDGAILLELYPLPDRLVVFLLDGQTLQVHTLDISAQALHEHTLNFLKLLWDDRLRARPAILSAWLDRELEGSLNWLQAQLWPVLARYLPSAGAQEERVAHLLLVPKGLLHFWPLWALPLPGSQERLLDRYACVVLPSADALPALQRQPVQPGPYRGFAPPSSLPFAVPQVRYEAAMLGGTAYIGREATFARLQESQGGITAFATHASSQLVQPERSSVALVGPDGKVDWVPVVEFLVGLSQLHSPLMGLWACEVHGVGTQAGDNWGGLTRAFLRAGRTLFASLWPIDDAATLALAVPLCAGLQAGLSMPQALRQAVRALRRADTAVLQGWVEAIAAHLPADEAAIFRTHWAQRVELPPGVQVPVPIVPFQRLVCWAPYLTIGWPGSLPEQQTG